MRTCLQDALSCSDPVGKKVKFVESQATGLSACQETAPTAIIAWHEHSCMNPPLPPAGGGTLSVRPMTLADLDGADELRRLAGWNQTRDDWRRWLGLEPEGCFVAVEGAQVVGTVTTVTYGQALAWIGMMLVHPEHRRRGIGTRLMKRALELLHGRGVSTVKLDATPAGLPVYEQLGFVSEWSLTRWRREAAATSGVDEGGLASATRALCESDWPLVQQVDRAAFGTSRSHLLRVLAQASSALFVWPVSGPPVGWGLLRSGAAADYLGPLASLQPECLEPLAIALLSRAADRPVVWDIPDANESASGLARRLGFVPLRPLTRMRRGLPGPAGNPQTQFAIADPAVG
jgi:predicted N-acetyltransferase YhbS